MTFLRLICGVRNSKDLCKAKPGTDIYFQTYPQMNLKNNYKDSKPDPLLWSQGKILPQAVDLEEAVLGAIMLEPEALNTIFAIFNPNVFYTEAHKLIAIAIIELKKQGIFPDILLVTEQLKKSATLELVGGAYYVTQLTNKVTSSANIMYHYRIVQQKFVQREFIMILHQKTQEAFDDTSDIFDLLDDIERKLRDINPINKEIWEQNSEDISQTVTDSILDAATSSGIYMFYDTSWPIFNKYVGTARNKIVTVGGASGHGKSRFISAWMFDLLDKYKDISIFWNSYEDSAEDILLFYLSQKFGIKSKDIKKRNFNKALIPAMKEVIEQWKKHDIHFVDRSSKIGWIKNRFELFCDKRQDKFPILILDNLLSVKDKHDFKGNDNAMEDYVMNELLSIRQNTHALIILVHHYNKNNFKDRNETGYRPLIEDLKGSERIPAVSNQVLLINNPKVWKELLTQYTGDQKEILKNMFILDPGKIRDDANEEESLIHFWCDMNTLSFQEINKPL